jgi:DNA-binding SARP family transcriptional activator
LIGVESAGDLPKAEETVDKLQIYTLGGLRVLRGDKPITSLETRKVEALLVYLACNQRAHPREVLADLLWDERSQQQAQSNLRVALANLRKHLGDYIMVDRDMTALNPEADVWIDMAEPEKGLRNWQAGKGLKSASGGRTGRTGDLPVPGDFLEGFTVRECRGFEDWSVRERERLHGLVVDSLHDLVAFELENAAYQAGLAHVTRLLEIDPLMEAAYCQRMALLACSGRRNEALAQYETLKRILWDELGIKPTEATEALLQKIRTGEMEQDIRAQVAVPVSETILTLTKDYGPSTSDASDFFGREALTDCLLAPGRSGRGPASWRWSTERQRQVVGGQSDRIPALRRRAAWLENWHILKSSPALTS